MGEGIDPGLLGRCGWEVEQTQRDVEVLAWVGRFRFVTPRAIGERFGVSWQQANARVRRLERLGLLGCERQHRTQPQAVFLTAKGHELLGWPRRRAPRADTQREHEAAIVELVTRLELEAAADIRVLTERECRQREAADPLHRYSVEVMDGGLRRDRRRWPDVVVETPDGRRAIEIEFAPKGTDRLGPILDAYLRARRYDETVFYVKSAGLGQRIKRLAKARRPSQELVKHLGVKYAPVLVAPWPYLQADHHAELAAKLASQAASELDREQAS